jgi:putative hydrolase of the HAD superfamily
LKAALFDLDNTLTDHSTAFGWWATEFSDATGIPRTWLMQAEERHNGARHRFFAEIKATYDIPDSVAALYVTYRRRSAELVPHRPQICSALEELVDDGWALGVVTNGAPDAQRLKLEVAGLQRYFGSVVISGEYGVRKPDEALLHVALDELRADETTWAAMVGDCLTTDIECGLRGGLVTVWVAAGRSLNDEDPVPTHTVGTTVEACRWLRTTAPNAVEAALLTA